MLGLGSGLQGRYSLRICALWFGAQGLGLRAPHRARLAAKGNIDERCSGPAVETGPNKGSKDPNNRVFGRNTMILMVFWALKPHYLGPWTLRVGCASGCMVGARRGSIRPSLLSTGMYGCNGHSVIFSV